MFLKTKFAAIILTVLLFSVVNADVSNWSTGFYEINETCLSSDENYIYVGGRIEEGGDGVIAKYDLNTKVRVDTTTVGSYAPLDVKLTPNGEYLYAPNTVNGYYTTKIATEGDTIITHIPGGTDPASIDFSSDGSKAYIVCLWSSYLQILCVEGDTTIGTITGIGTGALDIVLTPDDQFAYVGGRFRGPNPGDSVIYKISLDSNKIIDTIPVPCASIAITSDGSEIWAAGLYDRSYVFIVSTVTDQVVDSVYSGLCPKCIEISKDGNSAYVANFEEDSVSLISVHNRNLVCKYATGSGPRGLAITSNNDRVFVANKWDGTITEINEFMNNPLAIWIDSLQVNHGYSKIMMSNDRDISAFTLPLEFDSPYEIDSVVTTGCRTENWEYFYGTVNSDNTLLIGGVVSLTGETCMEPGEGCIAKVYWNVSCEADTSSICFDTTFISEQAPMVVVDCEVPENELVPEFTAGCSKVAEMWYLPGDANQSGNVNITDVVNLINYVFLSGPEPKPYCAGDANGDCQVNVSDAMYIINYIFQNGEPPVPYCSQDGRLSKLHPVASDIEVEHLSNGENKSLEIAFNSAYNLKGVQLEFSSLGEVYNITSSHQINGMQKFEGLADGSYKLGLLDMNGQAYIPAGNSDVVTITYEGSGNLELVDAILADSEGHTIPVTINNKQGSSNLPAVFTLSQNRPNPFNPTTEISYSLPEGCDVSLDIYNITGQRVTTLVNHYQDAGTHSVTWNSRDENGHQVASGIYFYRLSAGNEIKSKKMILMK